MQTLWRLRVCRPRFESGPLTTWETFQSATQDAVYWCLAGSCHEFKVHVAVTFGNVICLENVQANDLLPFQVPQLASKPASSSILHHACKSLGLVDGCLLATSQTPTHENEKEWVNKGDWLKLAHSLGAEGVFFVKDEPVLVLAELPEGEDEAAYFNRIWCMARPQVLFLAKEGELVVYKLAAPPVGKDEEPRSASRLLAMAESAAEILEKLSDFTRESIESGKLFGEERFGTGYDRADRALVHDLKIVRRQLTSGDDGLSDEVAHALIGRALFVRYLEDRKVLLPEYFEKVASQAESWKKLLEKPPAVFADTRHADLMFFRVLGNRELTYAFFRQLTDDFNGDTFEVRPEEQRQVKARHLSLLRQLLTGAADNEGQEHLFLFAYHFDIIPIELISSIYEEFYTAKRGKDNNQSSYYTPPALADYLLARVLTPDVLTGRPRVTDAACGSGIFLVEAFRRMVRHRMVTQGRRLSQRELKVILRDQIRGIDLNPEAVPVAAFSLYLAYLHYQDPREINETRRLPNLRWKPDVAVRDADQHLDILYAGNAFEAISSNDPIVRRNFGPASADVVVGNPPWGEVKTKDTLGRAALPKTREWLSLKPERIIGDNELSQAFVHLALELLADGGKAALLLSSGVLFKQHENSRAFRRSWLSRCKLEQVVNFAHVRHIFFADPVRPGRRRGTLREADGSSPFISAVFEKAQPQTDHRFSLWAARRTAEIEHTRAVVIAQSDMHRLRQDDCIRQENLWKLYWWGGRRDESLIRELCRFPSLVKLGEEYSRLTVTPAQGFKEANRSQDAGWLASYKELPIDKLTRYVRIKSDYLVDVPSKVERRGVRAVYEGRRLLIKQGIGSEGIVATLADSPFCFRNSVLAFRLDGFLQSEQLTTLAIVGSKLGCYYYWLTIGSWGLWHDQLHLHLAGSIPVNLQASKPVQDRICKIVGELCAENTNRSLKRVLELEDALDEAVFDLYELTEADRDLVRDMCKYGLDFFYRRGASVAVSPVVMPAHRHGTIKHLPVERTDGLTGYLQVFLAQWNPDLEPDGELAWEVIEGPKGSGVIAVLFSTITKGRPTIPASESATHSWKDILTRIGNRSLVPKGTRQAIYTDTFVRAVSEHEILIIKRNEARHWTRSMAREDADATISRAMNIAERDP